MPTTKHRTTLEQWRILQAVIDHGGYHQAGEALHRSPSSLNHAVAKLQQQLGVEILRVAGRKAELTPAGEVMLRRSRQLTDDAYQIETLSENLQRGWEPEIRLAYDAIFPQQQLLQALQSFHPVSRGSRLRLEETVLTGTHETVTQARADLVICSQVPKGYLGEYLLQIQMIPVCHPDHILNRSNQPLAPLELTRELQIVIRDSSQKPLEQQGWLRSEQRWTVDYFDVAIELLQSGLGFAWLPLHKVEQQLQRGELIRLQLTEGNDRRMPMHLVIPQPNRLGPGAQALQQALLDSLHPQSCC
ncbi:MAG: LysR family transcriptional regulator [Halopseudomonas sp.]